MKCHLARAVAAFTVCTAMLASSPTMAFADDVYSPLPEDSGVVIIDGSGPAHSTSEPKNNAPSQGSSNGAAIPELVDPEVYAREMFDLVNRERVAAGLNVVYWDDDFYICAQIRAEELTRKYGHERPEEPRVSSRESWPDNIKGGGVYNAPTVADELGVEYNWIMENAAKGWRTAAGTVDAWMNSTGHRDNILRDSHTRGAAAVYVVETDYGAYCYCILWLDS